MPDPIGQNIEQMPTPEQGEQTSSPEKKVEKAIEKIVHEKSSEQAKPNVVLPEETTVTTPVTDTVTPEKVGSVLSEGLDNTFLTMDVATQAKFKAEGEKTAQEITALMQKTKIKVKEIIQLIVNWLKIIPQVNKHFIEQEAKIKADKILTMYKKK